MWLCYVGFMVMELDSELSLVSHIAWPVFGDSGSFQWRLHHSAKMDSSGGLWEVGRTCGISFGPFPNSSGLLVACSVFLSRTSCHEITHARGYCGAWIGWVVSVSVPHNRTARTWVRRQEWQGK